ncbi:MAG: hypothetical protein ACTHKY_09720 [Ginsengibacter sp.]
MQKKLLLPKINLFLVLIAIALCLFSLNTFAQDSLKTKTEFKASGKISGYAFGDYAYKLHADAEKRGSIQYSKLPQDYNSFNFRRIYLGYDYQFSPNISSQFLLAHESTFEANTNNPDVLTDNNRAMYIKAMNIRFKNVIPRATIIAGQQATPTFSTLSEGIWGYRSIEKTIADMRGISSSTDLGIAISGKIGKNENVGYDVMVGNNNGAKVENNNFKKLYTSLYAYFLDKKLVIQGNYEVGRAALSPIQKNISTIKAFAAYKTSKTTVGVEAFRQIQTNNSTYVTGTDTAFSDVKPSGISFFLTQQLTKDKLNFFARFDVYNPDSKFNSNNKYIGSYNSNRESFATIGLDFVPYKNVHIMPNLWYDQFHSKMPDATGKLKNDYDLEGRITLYFLFNK